MSASKRRFTIEHQSDPVEFWSWLLNTLHMDLTGGRLRKELAGKGLQERLAGKGLARGQRLNLVAHGAWCRGAGYKQAWAGWLAALHGQGGWQHCMKVDFAITPAGGKSKKRSIIAVAGHCSETDHVPSSFWRCCCTALPPFTWRPQHPQAQHCHSNLLFCRAAAAAAGNAAGGKPKRRSIITDTFQGELEVTTLAGTGKTKAAAATVSLCLRFTDGVRTCVVVQAYAVCCWCACWWLAMCVLLCDDAGRHGQGLSGSGHGVHAIQWCTTMGACVLVVRNVCAAV
jgi:hypothetical protein